jgi:uncharacterized protein (TIGR01244 family)
MSDFRQITDEFWAAPQIAIEDVAEARSRGIATIVNNRPEGEAPDQPAGDDIERAATAAGLRYRAIPVTHAGFDQAQVDAMVEALSESSGPVLAYCRSGTRSTLLWSLAQARLGRDPQEIAAAAAKGGYDVAGVWPLIQSLAHGER